VCFELARDEVCRAGDFARRVDVLDAQQPAAPVGAGIEIAGDGGGQ